MLEVTQFVHDRMELDARSLDSKAVLYLPVRICLLQRRQAIARLVSSVQEVRT